MTDQTNEAPKVAETVTIIRHEDGTPMASKDSDGVTWLPTMEPVMHQKIGGEMFGTQWAKLHITHLALYMAKMSRYVNDAVASYKDEDKLKEARAILDAAHSGEPAQKVARKTRATTTPLESMMIKLAKEAIKTFAEVDGLTKIAEIAESDAWAWAFKAQGTWNDDAVLDWARKGAVEDFGEDFEGDAKAALEKEAKRAEALAKRQAQMAALAATANKGE